MLTDDGVFQDTWSSVPIVTLKIGLEQPDKQRRSPDKKLSSNKP